MTLILVVMAQFQAAGKTMSKREFIAIAFKDTVSSVQPSAKTLWLKDDIQSKISKILSEENRMLHWDSSSTVTADSPNS